MVDSLNLNSLTIDANGRVSFSGLGSGIDFQKAVDSIIAAKKIPVDTLTTKISDNEKQIAALKDLSTLVKNLKDSLNTLRGAISIGGVNDVFKSKAAFATTSRTDGGTASAAASLVGLTVTNASVVGSHTIEVLRVAAAQKVSSDAQASTTDPLGLAGTFQINGEDITVSAGDSLQSLVDRINNANTGADATGVTASIVSPSAGESYLILTADKTGTAMSFGDADGVLQSLGVLTGALAVKNELQAAQTARFTADGLTDPDRFESGLVANPNAMLSSGFTAASYPGSFDITGSGGSATINYTAATSLTDLANAINLETGSTNISATVQNDGNGYRLVLTETTGAAISVTDTNGLLGDIDLDNDLVIERTSNTVSDLFTGATINLFQAEEGTKIKIDVERDLTKVATQIATFVDAYNSLKVFLNQQTQIDPTTGKLLDPDAVLSKSRTVLDLASKMSQLLGSGATGVDSTFQVLDQIGITLIDNNTLTDQSLASTLEINTAKLEEALLNNPDAIRKMFAFDFTTSDSRVTLLGYSGLPQYNAAGYTLNIDYDTVGGQLAFANINGDPSGAGDGSTTINGSTITTTSATGAYGLSLLYTGNVDLSNVQLNFTIGLAAQMSYEADRLLDPTVGGIETEIDALEAQNKTNQDRVDRATESLDYQREQLLSKFIKMETALSSMNSMLDSIKQLTESLNPKD